MTGHAARGARVQRILAAAGVASRRHAEDLVRAGRVAINGRTARLGDVADPVRDEVTLDGERVSRERPAYWLLHKPRGVLTTSRDPEGRRTVLDLLPPVAQRLFPVGRLDWDSEGLVLLTNDGALAHVLLHPSHGTEREYRVRMRGELRDAQVRRIERGVRLEEGRTAPARVTRRLYEEQTDTTTIHLVLREGRKRQIRRMLQSLGHPVLQLVRVRMGPLRLGQLERGQARPLGRDEIAALQRHAEKLGSASRDER